jgi:ferrochelatase
MPAPVRRMLLEIVILPTRPRRSAKAYRKIWHQKGSPLLVNSRALRAALEKELGPAYVVELGMRYGQPSIRGALHRLCAADVARVLVLPLFPQYSTAATLSTIEKVRQEVEAVDHLAPIEMLGAFYADPRFIDAWGAVAGPEIQGFEPDHVLFSYHGLPESQIRRTDASGSHCLERPDCCSEVSDVNRNCYRAQCHATSRALASALALEPGGWSLAFQSRLGPSRWIRPYTDWRLPELASQGKRRLAVLCPAFVADCLETLEEVGIRLRAQWRELGGEALLLTPCPNAHPTWCEAVADLVRDAAQE